MEGNKHHGFVQVGQTCKNSKIRDIFYKRYGSFDILNECDTVEEMNDCIKTAIDENNNDKSFQLYCSVYPLMDKKTFKTFKTFEEFAGIKQETKVEKKAVKKKSVQEIMRDVELILMAK